MSNPLRDQMKEKYGGNGATAASVPYAGPAPKVTGKPLRDELIRRYTPTTPATSTPAVSTRDAMKEKYKTPVQPAATSTPATSTPATPAPSPFQSLDVAFPLVKNLIPGGNLIPTEKAREATSALLSIPKALFESLTNPDEYQREFERQAYAKTGNVVTDTITTPARFAGKFVTRLINPALRPFAEDISQAVQGNNPDAFNLTPQEVLDLPAMKKHWYQIVGDTAQAVLTAYTPTVVGRGVSATAAGSAKTALLTGAKLGGEAGAFFGLAQVASNDIRDPEEIAKTMFLNIAGGAVMGAVTTGAIPVAREGFRSLTEDITVQYQLPKNVYIDPRKVKDIFQTGNIISPEESAMIRELGLNGTQYRQAIKDGVNISVPAQKIITVADKPWWSKVKSAFGITPSNPNVKVTSFGDVAPGAEMRPNRLLGAGDDGFATPEATTQRILASEGMDIDAAISRGDIPESSVYADPKTKTLAPAYAEGRVTDVANKLNEYWPGLGDEYRASTPIEGLTMDQIEQAGVRALEAALQPPTAAGAPAPLALPPGQATAVTRALTAPVNAGLLAKLQSFTQEQQAAFGRNVIQSINEELGTNVTKGDLGIPDNIRIVDQSSADGRPAQYNGPNDRIEIFLPNLLEDLRALSRGQAILIHPDSPYTEVVRLQEGENIKDLVNRYIKEIVLHEAAHQKTPNNLADQQELQQITAEITQARLRQDQSAINAAESRRDAKIMDIENRANAYLKTNRAALEKEIFSKKGIDGDYNFDIEETDGQFFATFKDGPSSGARVPDLAASSRAALLRQVVIKNREGGVSLNVRPYESEINPQKAPNRFERRALNIPDDKQVTMTEKQALAARQKARAQGSREGYVAGKREATEKTKETVSASYENTIKKIRDRNASAASKRADLIEYASLLAYRDRGKFLKAINNTKTDKEFEAVLDRMRKAANLTDRANLIKEIVKELKGTAVKKRDGIPAAKFAKEQQQTLDQIRAAQKIFEERAKTLRAGGQKNASAYGLAQMEIANKIADWQSQNPDEVLPVEILHEVEVLKTVGLKDMTARELRAALASIKSLKEEGRMLKELERFNRDTEVQRLKDTVFDTITGGEPLPSAEQSIKRRDTNQREFFKKYARDSVFAWPDLLDKLSVKDKGTAPYESRLSRFGEERANEAFNTQNRGESRSMEKVRELFEAAYGTTKKREVLATIGDLQERIDLGKVKHADGSMKELKLSRGEAMQYVAWHRDETLDATFEETLGWGPEVWEKVEGILTPEDRRMIDSVLEFYQNYYEGINEVFSRDYGIDLPFNENYSPVHRDLDVTVPENVLLAQESAKYATARNGSLKDRVKNNIELKPTDILENVTRHIAKMEHYKAWSAPMYEFRRVFGDKQVRQAIADIHGTPYLKILDNFLNDFARDGVAREKVSVLADTLRKNGTKAILGLNIKSAIKQIPGVLNYGIELPAGDFFGGVADFWGDPIQKARFLFENSDTLQERFGEGFERDLKFVVERGYDKKLARAQNLSEVLFIPMRNADKLTVYMGAWAAFNSKFKEITGKPFRFNQEVSEKAVEEAIFYAERVTNRTQESSRLDTLAPLQRDGSWAKLFTMFQSQPSKYIRILSEIARNVKAGRETPGRGIKRAAWAWVVAPLFWNLLNDFFKDPEYREGPAGTLVRTLFGPLTYPLIFGQVMQTAYGWTQGESFEYKPSPAFAFADDMVKAMQQYTSDDVVDGTTYLIDMIGKLTGVPTTIITRPIRKGKKEGEEDAETGSAVSF